MEFKLTIRLGNDAMIYDGDVGRALIELGQGFTHPAHPEFEMLPTEEDHPIIDGNGNLVGHWEVTE